MLLTLDKWSTTKSFENPLIEIYHDDHDDIDLDNLHIKKDIES
jgi:hypothetical protein